jgi:hypothetical protein
LNVHGPDAGHAFTLERMLSKRTSGDQEGKNGLLVWAATRERRGVRQSSAALDFTQVDDD